MINEKNKSSFTLVELSIVLLVLSILVGVLLTGRKIVDRANLQRVIFEIDYYKKAFTMYRDTYDVYPGNMDEETCMKYAEFSQLGTENNSVNVGQYCKNNRTENNGDGKVNDGYSSSSLMATSERWTSFLNAMRFMQTSKIINEVPTTIADPEISNNGTSSYYTDADKGPWDTACKDCITYENVKRTQATTSFDANGAITLAGILLDSGHPQGYNLNFIRGSNNYKGDGQAHEFYDTTLEKNVNSRNVMFLYRNTPSGADDTYGAGSLSTGILTADITNQLDIKLDDGRPGTGVIIGLKNGYVHYLTDEKEQKQVCYNDLQKNVSTAYYVANTETKNGCNVMYIIK